MVNFEESGPVGGNGMYISPPEDNCPTRSCSAHASNKTAVPPGIQSVVKSVVSYSPTDTRELFEVYSFTIETPLVIGVFGGLTFAATASCPAMVAAAGPIGAAGCVISVTAGLGATSAAVAFEVKEIKQYLREKRRRR